MPHDQDENQQLHRDSCEAVRKLLCRLHEGERPTRDEWLAAAEPWCAIGGGYNAATFGNMVLNSAEGWVWKTKGAGAHLRGIIDELFPEAE